MTRRRLIAQFAVTLLVVAIGVAGSRTGEAARLKVEAADAAERWRSSEGVTGAVLAIEHPTAGRVIVTAGQANARVSEQLDQEARFRIGSVTKTFTAALVLQLASEGLIDIDRTLGSYGLGPSWVGTVTVRHLLSNRSGIRDYEGDELYADLERDLTQRVDPGTILERHAGSGLLFAPGTRYDYSSTNFLLLGSLVELVTGEPYEDVLRARLLEPLDLADTSLPVEDVPLMASGYSRRYAYLFGEDLIDTGDVPQAAIATSAWTGAGMVSSAPDLLTWTRALFSGRVVSEPFLSQMLTFDEAYGDYGLGVQRQLTDHGVAYGHGGVYFGYVADIKYFPESGTVIVALANDDAAEIASLTRAGARVALGSGARTTPGTEELASLLLDPRTEVRRQAALDLGLVDPPTSAATDLLREALRNDTSPEVRAASALALGLAGHADPDRSLSALEHAEADPDAAVRDAAAVAMGSLKQRLGR